MGGINRAAYAERSILQQWRAGAVSYVGIGEGGLGSQVSGLQLGAQTIRSLSLVRVYFHLNDEIWNTSCTETHPAAPEVAQGPEKDRELGHRCYASFLPLRTGWREIAMG